MQWLHCFCLYVQDSSRFSSHSFITWLRSQLPSFSACVSASVHQSILHNDLFLENVMFDGEELVGLIDFEEMGKKFS